MLLRHIRYLLAVSEHLNFTRAAEALHVSQPTLSQQIRQLEDNLGVLLFDRSGRSLRLTYVGEVYVLHARRALADLEAGRRAIHDVHDLSRGYLRLAMTPSFTAYLVGPLLGRFHSCYPGVVVTIREMPQERIEAELADDQLDLGIAFDKVRSVDVEAQILFVENLGLVVGADHPWAESGLTVGPQQLASEALALLSPGFATRGHVDAYCRALGITPRIAIEANSIGAIVEIVRRGRLATILPRAVALEQARMRVVALDPPIAPRTVALLRRRDAYQSAAINAFTELACRWGEEAN
ncbi:HTH-type transcriptional regulator CynR [compost metagenome]